MEMRRILIVHCGGGLGDILLATPLISALKRGRPSDADNPDGMNSIAVLLPPRLKAALEGNPDVDEILLDGPEYRGTGGIFRLASMLRKKRFHAAVIPWSTSRDAWAAWLAGIPVRVGQAGRLLYSFLFTHRVPVRSASGDVKSHWTDILLDYARVLGFEPWREGRLVLEIQPEAVSRAEKLLLESGLTSGRPLVGFHVGKGLTLSVERWPVSWFARTADLLSEGLGADLILTGSPSESSLVAAVRMKMRTGALDLSGRTSFSELAALIRRCNLFVCPDSGPMHMAAALGVPTVAVFALKSDFPDRWRPLGAGCEVLRPESWSCRRRCVKEKCRKISCYEEIPPEKVLEAAGRLLGNKTAETRRAQRNTEGETSLDGKK